MIAKMAIELFGWYYPETLGCFVIVEPPRIFRQLWNVLRPMLDDSTREKVHFSQGPNTKGGEERRKVLGDLLPQDLVEWMLKEVRGGEELVIPPPARGGAAGGELHGGATWGWAAGAGGGVAQGGEGAPLRGRRWGDCGGDGIRGRGRSLGRGTMRSTA